MLVECMVDLSNYVYQPPSLLNSDVVTVIGIEPRFAFINEEDVELYVLVD